MINVQGAVCHVGPVLEYNIFTRNSHTHPLPVWRSFQRPQRRHFLQTGAKGENQHVPLCPCTNGPWIYYSAGRDGSGIRIR